MNLQSVVPNRTLSSSYIWLDCVFLLLLGLYFVKTKRYIPLLVGVLGSLLYFVVDYGGFYLLLGTRKVVGADPFWFLLWLSTSYGFTNMAWMWLWFSEKEHRLEFSLLIILWWFCSAIISNGLSPHFSTISIERGTGSYHWIMAVFLLIGYVILIFNNLQAKTSGKAPLLEILAIGLLVQFAWEAVLFITGIRNAGIRTLVIDSLMETNLGAPYMYMIYAAVSKFNKKTTLEV